MERLQWWILTSQKWIIRAHGEPGQTFGELLCFELQESLDFLSLAQKWDISLAVLGELIADHCRSLEPE